MKSKIAIILVCALLLNSCIIKSLRPFYTDQSISYTTDIIGVWNDQKQGVWEIANFKEKIKEPEPFEKKEQQGNINIEYKVENVEFTDDHLEDSDNKNLNDLFNKGYFIKYTKKGKEATFGVIPFKIDNQYFLDFSPFVNDLKSVNRLLSEHLVATHSVAKVDISKDNILSLSWLNEERIEDLLEAEKIRLKHEQIGFEGELLLTASSEELYLFLKKYMKADIKDKWKTSDRFTLTKVNATP